MHKVSITEKYHVHQHKNTDFNENKMFQRHYRHCVTILSYAMYLTQRNLLHHNPFDEDCFH